MYTWLALIGAVITAALGAAFLIWKESESSPVPEIMFNVVIPLIVMGWLGWCYCITQRNNIRSQYISDVLQEKAESLLGSTFDPRPGDSGNTAATPNEISEKLPGKAVSNAEAEPGKTKIWGWDRWDFSVPFNNLYRHQLRLGNIIIGAMFAIALFLPATGGYVKIIGGGKWRDQVVLLAIPIVILIVDIVVICVGLRLLDRSRWPRITREALEP